jgi:phosphatidylinositol alpha 1,6-mannosyltransferase
VIDISDSESLNQIVNHHYQKSDRKQMRIAARDSVSMRSWARINDELISHYQDVINLKKSAAIKQAGVA